MARVEGSGQRMGELCGRRCRGWWWMGCRASTREGLGIFSTMSQSEKGLMISIPQIQGLLPCFLSFPDEFVIGFNASYCPKVFPYA